MKALTYLFVFIAILAASYIGLVEFAVVPVAAFSLSWLAATVCTVLAASAEAERNNA